MLEHGFAALSIEGIARRVGTTRPTVYRRYSGIPSMVLSIVLARFGPAHDPWTDSLHDDLLTVEQDLVAAFDDPFVRASLTGFLDSLHADPELADRFHEGFVEPRRELIRRILDRAADRGEIRPVTDASWVLDVLLGPLVLRASMTRIGRIDAALARATVDAIVGELRTRSA